MYETIVVFLLVYIAAITTLLALSEDSDSKRIDEIAGGIEELKRSVNRYG